MWGWELGTTNLAYTNSGWFINSTNVAHINLAHTDPHQPAIGYGGGSFDLGLGTGNSSRIRTPLTGPGSIGTHQRFIFHSAYKRDNLSGHVSWWNRAGIIVFSSGTTDIIRLRPAIGYINIDAIALDVWDGGAWVLQGTTTTTYTGADPYHRIVLDIDGGAGNYDVYIDGILEISISGSTTFTSIDYLWLGSGARYDLPNDGGRHDHNVLFDAGNHSTGSLVLNNIPLNNETVTIGAQTYTFKTTLTPLADEVLIGGSAVDSRRNLINAINLGPGSGTQYGAATTLNTIVTAEEDLATTAVHVFAKVKGVETSGTTDLLTGGGDGWVADELDGGDLDATNDLALALGDIYIQGLAPDADITKGSWLNVNGPNNGTNDNLHENVDDGSNLTDFIETSTSPDTVTFGHEDRTVVNPAWAPSEVHAMQSLQFMRGSGAITSARITAEIPSLGKVTSDEETLTTAGKIFVKLRDWRTGNETTDIDGIETGAEV
jgi:hypothetical protein